MKSILVFTLDDIVAGIIVLVGLVLIGLGFLVGFVQKIFKRKSK